jgi:hypothetical protein
MGANRIRTRVLLSFRLILILPRICLCVKHADRSNGSIPACEYAGKDDYLFGVKQFQSGLALRWEHDNPVLQAVPNPERASRLSACHAQAGPPPLPNPNERAR